MKPVGLACHVRALCYSATGQTLVHPLPGLKRLNCIRNLRNQRGTILRAMTKTVQLQVRSATLARCALWLPPLG